MSFTLASLGLSAATNPNTWKIIIIAIIVLILAGGLIYTGVKYQSAIGQVETMQETLNSNKKDLESKDREIRNLTANLTDMEKNNGHYVETITKIQMEKNRLQIRYNELMEKIRNAKLEVGKNGVIAAPYVVIPAGVPVEAEPAGNIP